MSFQLVDDSPASPATRRSPAKSVVLDVRAGKRSAPVVAALTAGTDASRRPPPARRRRAQHRGGRRPRHQTHREAGGIDWAAREADAHSLGARAPECVPSPQPVLDDLVAVARYVFDRDH